MTRNKLYIFLALALVAGYGYLIFDIIEPESMLNSLPTCLFKAITGLPCPSCGATHSVLAFINGDYTGALYWNPIGPILLLIMFVTPFWLLFDVLKKKDSFFNFYNLFEAFLKRKPVMITGIALVLINWVWNIYKGV